jgi:exodeoxyribonuclease V gamma subunit
MMHLYSADSARSLAGRLAEVLAEIPPDPMTPEWLAVPSDGMRRWLTLELARYLGASSRGGGDGITANFIRAYPGTLRSSVLNAERDDPRADPWSIDRLVWSVLAVADRAADHPDLAGFVSPPPGASRYAGARRVADLFDRYHLHRPDMIRSWASGDARDGRGLELDEQAAWQSRLWQLVRDEIGEASPPERLPALIERVRRGTLTLGLPPRLLLFGFTLLPGEGFLDLADAVATQHELHLFLLQPCFVSSGRPRARANDPVDQPLLRSWGRLPREAALVLAEAEETGLPPVERVESEQVNPSASTLLGRLQHDIRTDSAPRPIPVDHADRSIRFHACYGPVRQVQVLRDALLHLLAQPGTGLSEEDILVLCPDLDRFAPLVEAVFGRSSDGGVDEGAPDGEGKSLGSPRGRGAPALRFRIADQSIRTTNPMLGATAALLELVAGRFEAPAVLDFLALAPVRQRFRFDDDDLSTIAEWVADTEVRWGFDPRQRAGFGIPDVIVSNTWQAALDRLVLGATIHDDDRHLAVGGVAPFGVEGGDVEVLGRLAEAVRRLADLADRTLETLTVQSWVALVLQVTGDVFAAPPDAAWQMEGLHRILAEVLDAATRQGTISPVPLTFNDIRRLFDEQLKGKVGRPDFFRGGITVTSMTPLRWVPFRVVCILGMDQASFGSPAPAADDLIAAASRPGDRDPRAEARQALLEAVLAAGDHLVIVRDGRDVRTNQEIPRSLVAAELFEAVLALVDAEQPPAFAEDLEVRHPRHPFDEKCFINGVLGEVGPWGFDPSDLDGALARRRRAAEGRPFLVDLLPTGHTEVIDLADLHSFLRNPVAAFVSQALEVRLPRREEHLSTVLPVSLDPLEKWQVGDRMLSARLAGMDTGAWVDLERARGTLPPGVLEDELVDELTAVVSAITAESVAHGVRHRGSEPHEVDVELADRTRVVGTVPLGLDPATPGPARVQYSRVRAIHYLAAWLDLMVLAASDPSTPWRSVVIGRSTKPKAVVESVDLIPAASGAADLVGPTDALEVAVDCYRRGMREPIPLFPVLSHEQHLSTAKPSQWLSYYGRGDGDHPAVRLAFPGLDYRAVVGLPPRPGDPPGTGGRMARFADYLWGTVDRSADSHTSPDRPATASAFPEGDGASR